MEKTAFYKTRQNSNNVLDMQTYIIVFIMIYFSDDTLLFGTNKNQTFFMIKNIVLLVLFSFLLVSSFVSKTHISKAYLIITVFSCFGIILSGIVNGDLGIKYMFELLMIGLSFFIVLKIPLHDFLKAYVDIILFLCAASLIITTIFYINSGLLKIFPTITNKSGSQYYHIIVSAVPHIIDFIFFRNYGIFREPGVFQIFIVLAMIFEMFHIGGASVKRILIFSAALITTYSTTGIIALMLLVVYRFFTKTSDSNSKKKIVQLLSFFIVFAFIYFFTDLLDREGVIFSKLLSSNDSLDARVSSIYTNLYFWYQNFFFGAGWTKVQDNFALVSYKLLGVINKHNTNTFFKMLAVHGVFFSALWAFGVYKFFKKICISRLKTGFFFALLILLLASEDLMFNVIIYVFMFYGFISEGSEINKCELKEMMGRDHR